MAPGFTSARFVGRERELQRLAVALDHAESGRPTAVLVSGSSGIGISRLLAEAQKRLAGLSEPFTVLHGQATAATLGRPYAPIVAGLAPILEAASDETLASLAGPAAPQLARLVPSLAPRLASLGLIPEQPAIIAPERRQGRVLEGIHGLLTRMGEEHPIVLMLEDLHRADSATRALTTFLARVSRPQRVCLIATYQPDEVTRSHPLHGDLALIGDSQRPPERIELGPLDRHELASLYEGIEGERPSASILLLLAERSRGNPLVTEELLAVRREGSPAAATGSLAEIMAARLARRSPECRRVLRLLAPAGAAVNAAELAAAAEALEESMTGLPPRSTNAPRRGEGVLNADLRAGLAEAVDVGILRVQPKSGTIRASSLIAFRHEAIANAVAADLLPFQRRRHLAALARGLAASPFAAERYWLAAHETARAREAAVEAAGLAESTDAPEDALEHLELALELTELPDQPAADLVSVPLPVLHELHARAAELAFAAGRPDRAVAFAEAAISRADERRGRAALGRLYERMGRYRRAAGDSDSALAAHRRSVELTPRDATVERAAVLGSLAQVKMLEGVFSEAERLAQDALEIARSLGEDAQPEAVHALITLGVSRGWGEDPESGVVMLQEARREAQAIEDLEAIFRATANLTTVLDLLGRREEAVKVAFEGIVEARRGGLESVYGNFLRGNAADSLFLLGRWQESRDLSLTALEWSPAGVALVNSAGNLATVEIERDGGELAGRLLGQLLLQVETVGDAQFAVPIFQAAASYALWHGDLVDARLAVSRAWEMARVTEDWALIAKLSATVARVDAAVVADARGRRDLAGIAGARERTSRVLAEAEAAITRAGVSPATGSRREADAYLATARAHRMLADDRHEPSVWGALADTWGALGARYQVASARWRQAEAALTGGDDARVARAAARGPLREAYEIASELGARPLLKELRELARRALISLPEPTADEAATPAAVGMPSGDGDALAGAVAVRVGGNGHDREEDEAEGLAFGSLSSRVAAASAARPGLASGAGVAAGGPSGPTSSVVREFVGEVAPRRGDTFGLSPREKEVLQLIAQGRTNREIGERLFISQKTVGVHVGNILAKLDVSGRVEAAAVAIRLSLTEPT
jgi:predicted ATPase/DNA-binding CsgD family transcriptional regulator